MVGIRQKTIGVMRSFCFRRQRGDGIFDTDFVPCGLSTTRKAMWSGKLPLLRVSTRSESASSYEGSAHRQVTGHAQTTYVYPKLLMMMLLTELEGVSRTELVRDQLRLTIAQSTIRDAR